MDDVSRIWKPLDPSRREIRLLILAPNRDQHALPRGKLITVSLEQQLYYEAISHAWGDPSEPQYICINDIEWPINSEVLVALQQLRHSLYEKSFWIDALCINQFDTKERAEQVKLMQHIFHRAINVQAWLGRSPRAIESLIDDINDDNAPRSLFTQLEHGSAEETCVNRISAFMSLRYWTRTWVIQELALARSVVFVFRDRTFTMPRLHRLYKAIQQREAIQQQVVVFDTVDRNRAVKTIYPIIRADRLFRVATMGSVEEKVHQLVALLACARSLGCYDARDRIYGMIGIMTAMFGPDFIDADYERSVCDVYTHFAGRLIEKTGFLTILNQAEAMYTSAEGLPTWAADWTSRFSHSDARRRLYYLYAFRAAGAFSTEPGELAPMIVPFPWRPHLLKCKGHIFGTVQVAGAYWGSYRWHDVGRELEPVLEDWRRINSGSMAAFVRTITFSRGETDSDLAECYKAGSKTEPDEVRNIREACQDATRNRRFFVTNYNAPGLGPRDTRPGDYLAILAGGRVPYVLRPRPKSDTLSTITYSFVGECFVDGVMQGELFNGTRPPTFSDIFIE